MTKKKPDLKITKIFTGAELIAMERQRQINVEGWTADHDDMHRKGNIALAGVAYALDVVGQIELNYASNQAPTANVVWARAVCRDARLLWPWNAKWWKPTPDDLVRQLVKAGALIAAEIDRIQRWNKA